MLLLRLSQKELSAIEAVVDVALHGGGSLVQSSDITERQGIPPRYLEPILQRLGRAGILVGIRGPSGGYRLARERRRITLWDLVQAIRTRNAGQSTKTDGAVGPVTAAILEQVENEIRGRLAAITIEDLCWQARDADRAPVRRAGADFVI